MTNNNILLLTDVLFTVTLPLQCFRYMITNKRLLVKYIGQEKIVTVAQWNGIKFLFPLVRKQVVSRLNSEAFLTESHGKCTADTLSEPLKSAVEFTLATFYASSAAIEAKKFLASLPSMTTTDEQLKVKIDAKKTRRSRREEIYS